MDALDAIKTVEKSKEYASFIKEYSEAYLANCFVFVEPKHEKRVWNIGYYHPSTSLMSSFIVHEDRIEHTLQKETLKSDLGVFKLAPSKVKISTDQALEIVLKLQQEKYSKEIPIKIILILQGTVDGAMYNITFITKSFKTLNIKIDAKTGAVLIHNLQSLFEINSLNVDSLKKKLK